MTFKDETTKRTRGNRSNHVVIAYEANMPMKKDMHIMSQELLMTDLRFRICEYCENGRDIGRKVICRNREIKSLECNYVPINKIKNDINILVKKSKAKEYLKDICLEAMNKQKGILKDRGLLDEEIENIINSILFESKY